MKSVRIRHYGRSLAPEFILSRERTLAAGLQPRPADVRANRLTGGLRESQQSCFE